jgi:hypothetical protein
MRGESATRGTPITEERALTPIVEFPTVVQETVERFADLFRNAPERLHMAKYLTGLLVAEKKDVRAINGAFVVTTDPSCRNRWITQVDWASTPGAWSGSTRATARAGSSPWTTCSWTTRGLASRTSASSGTTPNSGPSSPTAGDRQLRVPLGQALPPGSAPLRKGSPVPGAGLGLPGPPCAAPGVGGLDRRTGHPRGIHLRQLVHLRR